MVLIKGLQKTCLVDFEPYTACTVFLGGCNFRCGYCHNPDLVLNFNDIDTIEEKEFFSFLDERKKWLDGVCVTGGEPCMQKDLVNFISKIKDKGLLVKLDTNGTNPIVIKELIDKGLLDYIAMDIKTNLEDYHNVACTSVDIPKLKESIGLIQNSKVNHEFRTTVIPGLVEKENIIKIGKMLKGSKKYVLQNFNPKNEMIENRFKNISAHKKGVLEEMKSSVQEYFDEVVVKD